MAQDTVVVTPAETVTAAPSNTNSLSKTANIAASTGGGIVVAKWAIGCVVAHHLQMPDDATLTLLCAALAPLVHGAEIMLVSWFGKKTGIKISVPDLSPEQLSAIAEKVASVRPLTLSEEQLALLAEKLANANSAKPNDPQQEKNHA